jgi:hypothetical protein
MGRGLLYHPLYEFEMDDEKSVPDALDIQKHNLKPIINPNNIPVGSSPV